MLPQQPPTSILLSPPKQREPSSLLLVHVVRTADLLLLAQVLYLLAWPLQKTAVLIFWETQSKTFNENNTVIFYHYDLNQFAVSRGSRFVPTAAGV